MIVSIGVLAGVTHTGAEVAVAPANVHESDVVVSWKVLLVGN